MAPGELEEKAICGYEIESILFVKEFSKNRHVCQFNVRYWYLVASITVSFRRNEVTEKSLITQEKISPFGRNDIARTSATKY